MRAHDRDGRRHEERRAISALEVGKMNRADLQPCQGADQIIGAQALLEVLGGAEALSGAGAMNGSK